MRPMLKPALVPMWRSSSTLQLGLAGGHTRVIEGFDDTGRMVLGLLDGTRDLEQIHREAQAGGADRSTVTGLLRTLSACSLLDDAALDAAPLRSLGTDARARLGPELSALSLLHPGPGEAAQRLSRRRSARLAVAGPPVLVDRLVELLEAAGLRRPSVYADLLELAPRTVGRRAPDFLVLATVGVLDVEAYAVLDHLTVPHLAVSVRELTGIVGPLVAPRNHLLPALSGAAACRPRPPVAEPGPAVPPGDAGAALPLHAGRDGGRHGNPPGPQPPRRRDPCDAGGLARGDPAGLAGTQALLATSSRLSLRGGPRPGMMEQ